MLTSFGGAFWRRRRPWQAVPAENLGAVVAGISAWRRSSVPARTGGALGGLERAKAHQGYGLALRNGL